MLSDPPQVLSEAPQCCPFGVANATNGYFGPFISEAERISAGTLPSSIVAEPPGRTDRGDAHTLGAITEPAGARLERLGAANLSGSFAPCALRESL